MKTPPQSQDQSCVDYRESTASVEQINSHLLACSALFTPPLAERVELPEYANKLHSRATTFEAWAGRQLIGLVAAYLNQGSQDRIGFVTNVSVEHNFVGRGIGNHLLTTCHRRVVECGVDTLRLEVSRASDIAIRLYRQLGYRVMSEDAELISMEINLGERR